MTENRRYFDLVLFPSQGKACGNWSQTAGAFAVNFLSFLALGTVAFQFNKVFLYNGQVGTLMLTIAKQQLEWNEPMLGFTNNFLQSLGNVWFPLNTRIIPGYFFSEFLNSGELDPTFSFLIFSAELFVATYLLCLFLRLGPTVAALAAWSLPLLVMPFFEPAPVYPVMWVIPHLATVIAATILILILFGQIGRNGRTVSCLCICGAGLLLGYTIVAIPDKLILMAPVLSVFGLCSFATVRTRSELSAKLGGAGLLMVALLLSGAAAFLVGIFRYTAPMYFSQELFSDRTYWIFVSILFHDHQPYGGPIMFTIGTTGALVAIIWGSGPARSFASGTLIIAALLILSGLTTVYFDFWKGPSPLYVEFFLWPFYAVYGAVTLAVVIRICADIMRQLFAALPVSSSSFSSFDRPMFACLTIAIAVLPWLIFASARSYVVATEPSWPYPPHRTPIVTLLEQEIGVTSGSLFRGRAATFTGLSIDRPITLLDLHGNDYGLIKKFGNDHRMIGLWYYNIPTLAEDSNLITPAYYLVTSRLLGRAGDRQMRTAMTLRAIDPRVLRMMGVRFLVTDAPIEAGARLGMHIPEGGEPVLFLYELAGVNLGDYSPTEIVQVEDARSAMSILAASTFDPRRSIIVDAPLPGRFLPATSSRIFVEKSGLRLSARSEGTSLLLLPLEYSHCLKIESTGTIAPLRLFRANLLQTGIVFTGNIEANLSYFTGPLRNSACRVEDARDMDRLKIREQVAGK